MKIRFKGGHTEEVQVRVAGKAKNVTEPKQKEQLTQMLQGVEYCWPVPGAVVTVPPNIGRWLVSKHSKVLEELPDDPEEETFAPNRIVGVVPSEAKAPPKPPAQPPTK